MIVWRKSLHQDHSPLLPFKPVQISFPWASSWYAFVFSFQMPLLSWKLPADLTKSQSFIRWKILEDGKTLMAEKKDKEKHISPQNDLATIQRQKSFPHFRARSRQQEGRGRPAPTAQSFKTNETLCVSRVDRGPAQARYVHHSLHGLCASGTGPVWNRTGSSLILSPSLLLRLDWTPNAFWFLLNFPSSHKSVSKQLQSSGVSITLQTDQPLHVTFQELHNQ